MSEFADTSFPTTHWSQIALADHEEAAVRSEALRQLLLQYTRPMQLHLRFRFALNEDAAEEIVQDFLVSKVLDYQLFARAQEGKGRFRTYLLTALDRFASNSLRNQRSRNAGPLDDASEPIDSAGTADAEFDAAWAREVIAQAMRRMREECVRHDRKDIWRLFEERLIAPAFDGAQPVPYERLVEQREIASVTEGSNLLVTAKRAFARALRSVVGEYEKSKQQIEHEVSALRAALSRSRPG